MYQTWTDYIHDVEAFKANFQPKAKLQDYRQADRRLYNILDKRPTCPAVGPNLGTVFDLGTGSYSSKILETIYQNYFDVQHMRYLECFLNSLLTNKNLDIVSDVWLREPRRIGAKSSYGDVYAATVGGYSDLVIFKVDRKRDEAAVVHEYVIGLVMNKLRSSVVNFVYTYRLVQCHYSFCESGDPVIMQELVTGPTISSLIKSGLDEVTYLSIVLQLIFSLRLAFISCQFQHLDLHPGNILARTTQTVSLSYTDPSGRTIYVLAPVIATMIDFGYSSVTVDINGISTTIDRTSRQYFLNSSIMSPLTDIFKLVGFSYVEGQQRPIGRTCLEILKFFVVNPTIPDQQMAKSLLKYYFNLPDQGWRQSRYHTVKEGVKMFDDLLEHIATNSYLKSHYNRLVTERPQAQLLYITQAVPLREVIASVHPTSVVDYLLRLAEEWPTNITPRDLIIVVSQLIELMKQYSSVKELVRTILLSVTRSEDISNFCRVLALAGLNKLEST
jgi:serine/threonine protein kinase